MSGNELEFIPTRSSVKYKNSKEAFQLVLHNSYKKKADSSTSTIPSISTKSPKTHNEITPVNIKRIKHEVVKFGMSGFDPSKKEEAKVQLAIKLGAKPRKNKCKNYKQFLEEKKKEKEEMKAHVEFQQLGKNQIGKSNAKGKSYDRKRKKADLLDDYGKVKVQVKRKPL